MLHVYARRDNFRQLCQRGDGRLHKLRGIGEVQLVQRVGGFVVVGVVILEVFNDENSRVALPPETGMVTAVCRA